MSKTVQHGGQVYEFARQQSLRLSESIQTVLDFSASINPIVPEIDWQKLTQTAQIAVSHYPDQQQQLLKQAIAKRFKILPEQITLTNGISSAIMTLFAEIKPDLTLLFTPIYSEYQRAAQHYSQQVIELPHSQLDDFDSRQLTENSVLVLVNPNTPQGQYQSLESLQPLLKTAIKHNCWCLIDESFLPFISLNNRASVRSLLDLPQTQKWIVLQSLTKYYACPGVRIGALFSASNTLTDQNAWQWPSWPISVLDEQFLLQALSDPKHQHKTAEFLSYERPAFIEALNECDLIQSVESGLANFLLVKTTLPAAQLVEALQAENILIRDCESFGLGKYHCRIAIKTAEQNQQLTKTLQKLSNQLQTESR